MCCHCCFGEILAKVKLALSPSLHDRTVLTIAKKKEVEIKIDTKVTSTHHNVSKHGNKPIRIAGYYQYLAQSARKKAREKIARTKCDWFWVYLSLAEKLARNF